MKKNAVRSESPVPYGLTSGPDDDDSVIAHALAILRERVAKTSALENPDAAAHYCSMHLASYDREVFAVLYLDARHRVIATENLFYGTIDAATVHPREVVKAALLHNAAAVIFTHNHPSGCPEPSAGDQAITRRLVDAMRLIDIRVLDHIVVGGGSHVSMAARGLL